MSFPERRLRRLRRTPTLRRMVAETRLSVDDLIAPLFVREGIDEPQPILSLPGVVQHTRDSMVQIADLCLDEYTDHGHCGVLDADGNVRNDETVELYARVAVAQATAGA